jgi:nitrogen fixation/metabolism regulation signal transduction histidine kinase
MSNTKNRRKKLIINPTLQRQMIKDMVKIPILTLTICTILVASSFWAVLPDFESLETTFPGIYKVMFGLLLSVVCLVFLSSLFITMVAATRISNRVAGPLYRLTTAMEQILKGEDHVKITLRKGDYLEDIVDNFNRFLSCLEEQHGSSSQESSTEDTMEDKPEPAEKERELTNAEA